MSAKKAPIKHDLRIPTDVEWNLIAESLTSIPTSIQEIADKAGVPVIQASMILTSYTLDGFVKEGPIGKYAIMGSAMSASLLDFLVHGVAMPATATATASWVARKMATGLAVTSPEAVIRVIDDRKDEKKKTAGVYSPSTLEGDAATVDLGTLLSEIDQILSTPGKMGEVVPVKLQVVREGG